MDRARVWLIDSRGLAKKVKNAALPAAAYHMQDCGAKRHCPNCQFLINNSDVYQDWQGLPAGVKFDPSDVELLGHLAAKRGVGELEPHIYIDEFIPTLEGDEGICYTHPENLPGAKKDGSSVHFFYRITNAYSTGQRKRRRIQDQKTTISTPVRWHKTGKTKPIMDNGVQKGFKKIMVLYAKSRRGSKPDKCKWVMHQFHLGTDVDEKEGEYVVSKVFYQLKENDKNESTLAHEEPDMGTTQVIPRTPRTNTPDPPRLEKTTPPSGCGSDVSFMQSPIQEAKNLKEASDSKLKDEMEEYATPFTGEFKPVDLNEGRSPLWREMVDAYQGLSDLDNLELDTPPDFQITDLLFASLDSFFDGPDQL